MALLLGFFFLSILFSFLCSIWEAVILSVTPSYIKRQEKEGNKSAKLLKELKEDIDKPLSGILTLNTVAHTVGAIGVGAQAGKLYGTQSANLFGLEISYESIIATLMTLAILFLSEIIPKTIGANYWQKLAPFTAKSLKFLTLIFSPFIWVSNSLVRFMKKEKGRSVFSKQDFSAMAEVVEEGGEIAKEDLKLIQNVLAFDELTAKDVMTPQKVIVMAEQNVTIREYYDANKPLIFSRIPLYDDRRDNVTGIMLRSEFYTQLIDKNAEAPVASIRRDVITVNANTSLREVFQKLHDPAGHIAMVVDEYGTLVGLVTLEDIIETLFGLEIMDETDAISDLQEFARKKWEERVKKLGLELRPLRENKSKG